jgi:hypothetical protein
MCASSYIYTDTVTLALRMETMRRVDITRRRRGRRRERAFRAAERACGGESAHSERRRRRRRFSGDGARMALSLQRACLS